ncbi:S-adenosyl-L-methionine-dependent methyltransferase, partial [Lasiosphaeria miniovina]
EDELERELIDVIDLTGDEYPVRSRQPRLPRPVDPDLSFFVRNDGFRLETGIVVELLHPLRDIIRFLKIRRIVRSRITGETLLRGFPYARAKELRGFMSRKLNEVCMVVHINNADPRQFEEQALITIHPDKVLCEREMRTTNSPFPNFRFEEREFREKGRNWIKNEGLLVCRYKYIEYYNEQMGKSAAASKKCEWAFIHFTEDEADSDFRLSDSVIANNWRGDRVRGGSYLPDCQTGGRPILIEEHGSHDGGGQEFPIRASLNQKYSAGDVFAGAGGASRGIVDAGLRLLFALDHWRPATESLSYNFLNTDIHEKDVTDFISDTAIKYRVDILHLSPPCQVWSPAHTVAGQNDEMNEAVLFSCTHLISKTRPRVFTLEQTFGILHQRFEQFFNTLVCGFTDHGYSIRWKVMHLASYGLPQPRKRLIMIGAGPGEKLPPFPKPTHSVSNAEGLKPLVTVRKALAHVDRQQGHPHHRKGRYLVEKTAWDPNQLLKYTITCGGGLNYHWSGKRDFTLLEYARLQGFPVAHEFRGSSVKKQIGNAFPPSVVKVLYQHLTAFLDEQDQVTR